MTRRGGDFLDDQTHGSVLKELVRDVLAHEQQTLVVAKYFYHKNQGQYGFTEVHWVKRLLVTLPEMSKFTFNVKMIPTILLHRKLGLLLLLFVFLLLFQERRRPQTLLLLFLLWTQSRVRVSCPASVPFSLRKRSVTIGLLLVGCVFTFGSWSAQRL